MGWWLEVPKDGGTMNASPWRPIVMEIERTRVIRRRNKRSFWKCYCGSDALGAVKVNNVLQCSIGEFLR